MDNTKLTHRHYNPRDILNVLKPENKRPPISSGFKQLDECLNGGFRNAAYLIGARPGAGKTSLALRLGESVLAQGKDVLVFSLEMDANTIIAKFIARRMYQNSPEHAMSYANIAEGSFNGKADEEVFIEAFNELSDLFEHLTVVDRTSINSDNTKESRVFTVDNIEAEIVNEIDAGKQPLVIVDYLQNIDPRREVAHADEVKQIDDALKTLIDCTKIYNIPILIVSSVTKAAMNEAIDIASFKGSSSVMFNCESILGLDFTNIGKKNFSFEKEATKKVRDMKLRVLKSKSGEYGSFDFKYRAAYEIFTEVNQDDHFDYGADIEQTDVLGDEVLEDYEVCEEAVQDLVSQAVEKDQIIRWNNYR